MKTLILLLASAAIGLSAVPSVAAKDAAPMKVTGIHSDEPYTIRVSYGDLDLANKADAEVLRARFKRAALRTCNELYAGSMLQRFWACRDAAWRAGAPQIVAAVERAEAGRVLAQRDVVLRLTGY